MCRLKISVENVGNYKGHKSTFLGLLSGAVQKTYDKVDIKIQTVSARRSFTKEVIVISYKEKP